jgi:hypothetical protein
VSRKVPPPDFRFVWLMPGPSTAAVTLAAGTVGATACGIGLWNVGHQPLTLALTLGVGALATLALARSDRRLTPRSNAREVNMAIVPWGVLISPDTEPRVLRWPAIRSVRVDVTHALQGGTPSVISSLVTITTEHESLAGRAPGSVALERLVANLEAYAEESSRPVAGDLDGNEPAGEGATEPVAALLLRTAIDLCQTSRGAAQLELPPAGYRTVATPRAAPETVEKLRATLRSGEGCAADPRPLAAMVAGLLGASELVPDLLCLVSSPHPMVSAAAKGAALRLGAPRNRAGSLDEVAAFLFEEDLCVIREWAEG